MSMETLSQILKPGQEIGYEVRQDDRVIARSWGRYERPESGVGAPAHRLRFWQEYPAGPGRSEALYVDAVLSCDDSFRPRTYRLLDTLGRSLELEFSHGSFKATLHEGTTVEAPCGDYRFLLSANMIPQLAIMLRLWVGGRGRRFLATFFSPELLRTVPYRWTRRDFRVQTSFDETIELGSDGWLTQMTLGDKRTIVNALPPPERPRSGPPLRARSKRPRLFRAAYCRSEDLQVESPNGPLGATLTSPIDRRSTCAYAVFFAGSGSHDRHGLSDNLDLGYHRWMGRLARCGIASLRFDKRGAGQTPFGSDVLEPSYDLLIRDSAAAMVAGLSRCTASRPLFLIGHSQGGLVALELAARRTDLAGLVLLNTAGRRLDEVVEDQVRWVEGRRDRTPAQVGAEIREVRRFFRFVRQSAGRADEDVPPRYRMSRHLYRWYREICDRDPVALIQDIRVPILIVQGTCDTQVSVADARLLEEAALKASIPVDLSLVERDHLFHRQSGDTKSEAGDSSVVTELICRWARKVLNDRRGRSR
jgi:pimeloyl-ACP methyl ester carboxylesterase